MHRPPSRPEVVVHGLALVFAGLVGAAAAVSPTLAVAAAVAALVFVTVALYPQVAAYLLAGVTPLVAGMDRGLLIPVIRPSEAVALLVGSALIARRIPGTLAREPVRIKLQPVEKAVVLLAVTSSVAPMLWLTAKGARIAQDDVLYAVVLWKYLGVYAIVRASVRSEAHVRNCLLLVIGSAVIVGTVGILQALKLFGVPELLGHLYAPTGDRSALEIHKATSTLAHAQAFADFMIFSLAVAVGWLAKRRQPANLFAALAVFFALSSLASGQFSGLVGLIAGAGAAGWITRHLRRGVLLLLPFLLVSGVILRPVVQERLDRVDSSAGLPNSWLVRQHNLQEHFLPQLKGLNLLFGVRPAARLPAPETLTQDWLYIESGHIWLLWTGGIPLFAAFFWFLWVAIRATAGVARTRDDAVGVAAAASFAALVVLAVVTIFDAHLTIRGTADLNFTLLALAMSAVPADMAQERESHGANTG